MCLTLRGSTVLITRDFSTAFVILGGMSILSSLLFLRLEPRAGAEVSGGRARSRSRSRFRQRRRRTDSGGGLALIQLGETGAAARGSREGARLEVSS